MSTFIFYFVIDKVFETFYQVVLCLFQLTANGRNGMSGTLLSSPPLAEEREKVEIELNKRLMVKTVLEMIQKSDSAVYRIVKVGSIYYPLPISFTY